MIMSERLHMPALTGATAWLNSEPLRPADLRGHVVLVDFWTLTCINWLRTEPYIRSWARTYRMDGLVVIGVHTPEFSFEHDVDRVRRAIQDHDIDYPVVVDNSYAIWTAFANHYWPALYFVDAKGIIRDHHFGEGRYEESEALIQRLLDVQRDILPIEGHGVEAAADWGNLYTSETYLGHQRGQHFAAASSATLDRPDRYELPLRLPRNHWGLDGEWTVASEAVVLNHAGGSIAFRFHARDVHLVLSLGTKGPVPFRVLVDGAAPGGSHGVDVDADGNGVLDDGRMYQLFRASDEVRERTLKITFHEPGAQAYSFTFG
jgi:thiol-disulfide isomerase/thioredoxin